jgi:hypothetical protein
MQTKTLHLMLSGGDRRSNRPANVVVEFVLSDTKRLPGLMECLWDPDALIRMRAADALEKISVKIPAQLQRFKTLLLGFSREATQQEVRWHLAQIIPRLRLTDSEITQAAEIFASYLSDRSSIVKTFAMQSLADLAAKQPALQPFVREHMERLAKTGRPPCERAAASY